ncbi:MAG: hypothetical protein JXN61_00205 [Sedimentisphaerales bacterium]|nr:hypothetical protein [Sedimentisphaerales bacterium]
MFKDEADFEKIVGRLNIDDQPNPAHREKLRRQVLNAFDEASKGSAGRTSETQAAGTTIPIRPLLKFAAAAVILIAAIIGIHQLKRPDKTVTVAKDDKINPSEAVHIGTPELAPIELELPRPMFVGTPQDTRVVNLEKPLGRPRPPFMAPLGTRNVAEGKPVSSSDQEPIIGDIGMITDGDKEAADGSYVELGPLTQHITIDLEAVHDIYAVVVWHYHKQSRVYFDVVVQVADDADFTKNVKTIFNNDIDNSAGLGAGKDKNYVETNEGKLIDAKGIRGRYVRLYSRGNTSNDLNHYIEAAIYGIPVE